MFHVKQKALGATRGRGEWAMMNRMESTGEAKLRYLDGDFEILKPGAFVRCSVTGEAIPLDALRYWSVARQEPYANAAVSLRRELEADPKLAARVGRG